MKQYLPYFIQNVKPNTCILFLKLSFKKLSDKNEIIIILLLNIELSGLQILK